MKYKHKRLLLQWNPLRVFISWMKRVRFSKYEDVSLYKIFRLFLQNLMDDEILDRANGVAYNFILAVFPAIIFLFTLIPYASNFFPEVTADNIMVFLGDMLPKSMYDVVSPTVLDIVGNQRGGLLSLGFVFSLYLSTNGTMALMRAFNACYRTVERRSAWKTRLIATGLTINLAFVVFLAIVLLVVGQFAITYIGQWLSISDFAVFLLLAVRFVVIFIVFFLAISTLYYFGPAIHYNWRFFSVGSLIATFLTLGVSYGFSYYVTNFATYNKVYGSIGVLIAIMVWIQLITVVLLIGYEINASVHNAIRKQALWNARRYRRQLEGKHSA